VEVGRQDPNLPQKEPPQLDFRVRSQRPRTQGSAGGHHLGRSPKRYRKSKTGRMLSNFPELDFRPEDNSGLTASDVPAGTFDTAVFRCRACGARFEAIIANRVAMRINGRRGDLCAQCTGWLPSSGNSLADLPGWLLSQLRLPDGADPAVLPLRGGSYRRYWWECSNGHWFQERVGNRLQVHRNCGTEAAHTCGCSACRGTRPVPDNNLRVAHPEIADRLDRMADANGYAADSLPAQGGAAKHVLHCGAPGHRPYVITVAHALRSATLGCPDCRVARIEPW